jgi:hypothetical protein
MALNPEDLQVTSFSTESDSAAIGGGGTEYPICIVYVSDCVSCPPDQDTINA